MSGYVFGRGAERDLDGLWEYVAQDSVEEANRLLAKIFEAFEALARNPGMGHKREDLTNFPVLFWPAATLARTALLIPSVTATPNCGKKQATMKGR
jgi:hypothetical protein